MYLNEKKTETNSSIFLAVCALKGANCDHDAKQKLSLLIGSNRTDLNKFNFSQVCSFNVLDDDSIAMTKSIKNDLSEEHRSLDKVIVMTLAKLASVQLIEIIVGDEYLPIWDSEIPTPTEVLEVYFSNKMYIFGHIDINDEGMFFTKTENPERQLRAEVFS
jgi:hypothetical protein